MFRTSLLVASSVASGVASSQLELEGSAASVVLDVDGSAPVVVNKAYLDALATDAEVDAKLAAQKAAQDTEYAAATDGKLAAQKAVQDTEYAATMDTKIDAYDKRFDNKCPNGSFDSYGVCVWHINGYNKNATQAQAACASAGARLCRVSEMWKAWEGGAQWCSNGWTENDPPYDAGRYTWGVKSGFKETGYQGYNKTFRWTYPMQKAQTGCGSRVSLIGGTGLWSGNLSTVVGANCCKDMPQAEAKMARDISSLQVQVKAISALTAESDCPNGSLDQYGVCIWHVGTYDKNVTEAQAACAKQDGGRLCYTSEVWQAWEKGAQWCSSGWTENDPTTVSDRFKYIPQKGFVSTDGSAEERTYRTMYPMQNAHSGCGSAVAVIGGSGWRSSDPAGKAAANCCISTAKQKARTNEVMIASIAADTPARCPNDSYKQGVCAWHIGSYDKDVEQAKAACAAHTKGGRLCTLGEMWKAWDIGMQWCSNGWTQNDVPAGAQLKETNTRFTRNADGTYTNTPTAFTYEHTYRNTYPMQTAHSGCGSAVSLIGGGGNYASDPTAKAGANCCLDV